MSRKQVVAKKQYKQKQKNKQLTTILTYKHTDLLKAHTHKTKRVRKITKNVHMYKKSYLFIYLFIFCIPFSLYYMTFLYHIWNGFVDAKAQETEFI